ncbi:MAG: hypothetical protein KKF44_09885 [Nanoarchaeota archaeon]|nr:hypothetical protein [Nanoarchaeota archaeon]
MIILASGSKYTHSDLDIDIIVDEKSKGNLEDRIHALEEYLEEEAQKLDVPIDVNVYAEPFKMNGDYPLLPAEEFSGMLQHWVTLNVFLKNSLPLFGAILEYERIKKRLSEVLVPEYEGYQLFIAATRYIAQGLAEDDPYLVAKGYIRSIAGVMFHETMLKKTEDFSEIYYNFENKCLEKLIQFQENKPDNYVKAEYLEVLSTAMRIREEKAEEFTIKDYHVMFDSMQLMKRYFKANLKNVDKEQIDATNKYLIGTNVETKAWIDRYLAANKRNDMYRPALVDAYRLIGY